MNILFVSAILPYPLYSGGQVRIYNLLKRLSKKHTITLLSFIRNEKERQYAKNLNFLTNVRMIYRGRAFEPRYLVRAFGVYPTKVERYPLLLETYNNEEMRNCIKQELDKSAYDLVHIEPFYVYPSLPDVIVPLVVGEHNIEYDVYDAYARTFPVAPLRPLMMRDARRIRHWEEKVWREASSVVAVSAHDATIISCVRSGSSQIVPNGVDTGLFRLVKHTFDISRPTFLFVGNFNWVPNVEAITTLLTTIWSALVNKYPDAHLTIIGRNFPQNLQSYISSHVSVKSDVPDIRKDYQDNDILLAPMGIAGGSKYKILEAMASGTAVVATQAGIAGIDCLFGTHAHQAETPQDFVNAVHTIYQSPKQTVVMTKHARDLIEEKYNWDIIAKELDSVWRNVK